MATVTKPIALDESFNTTEQTPRNIADVLAEGLSHITGRTASEVEYDNSESGLTSDDVQGAIDELSERPTLPTTDIQTAVDEFETYNGGLLSECKVALSPNQDLHGYAEPWVGGAGKNKYDDTAKTSGAYLITDGTTSGSGASDVSDYIPIKNGDVVMLSYHYNTLASANARNNCLYDENKQFVDYMTYTPTGDDGFKEYKITISNANAKYIRYTLDKQINHVQVEFGSTATAYEPYENICPISGHTQVDVDVSDGQTTQEQVTVNLGGTYYSGTLDVVSGVLTVDKVKAVTPTRGSLDSSGKLYTISFSGGTIHNYTDTGIVTPYVMCSHLDVDSLAGARDTQRKCICQYAGGVYIGGYVGEETALDNMLASADFSIVFELATPTSIQLSPTMVKALVGENHLDAPLEGQEITESEYRELFTWDEVEAYVNAHSGGGSGMNYSTNEQVIGTWTDGKPLYQKTFIQQLSGTTGSIDISSLNISEAFICGGFYDIGVTNLGLNEWLTENDNTYAHVNKGTTPPVIDMRCTWANAEANITLQYTKTTD